MRQCEKMGPQFLRIAKINYDRDVTTGRSNDVVLACGSIGEGGVVG
jgi:hypothetical protein